MGNNIIIYIIYTTIVIFCLLLLNYVLFKRFGRTLPFLFATIFLYLVIIEFNLILFRIIPLTIENIIYLLLPIILSLWSLHSTISSENRTRVIGRTSYLDALANILNTRFVYFDKIRELRRLQDQLHYDEIDINQNVVGLPLFDEYQRCIEYATWKTYFYLRIVLVSHQYIELRDRNSLFNSYSILFNNVLRNDLMPYIKNRHVEHMLMSLQLLYDTYGEQIINYRPEHQGLFTNLMDYLNQPYIETEEYLRAKIQLLNDLELENTFNIVNLFN